MKLQGGKEGVDSHLPVTIVLVVLSVFMHGLKKERTPPNKSREANQVNG